MKLIKFSLTYLIILGLIFSTHANINQLKTDLTTLNTQLNALNKQLQELGTTAASTAPSVSTQPAVTTQITTGPSISVGTISAVDRQEFQTYIQSSGQRLESLLSSGVESGFIEALSTELKKRGITPNITLINVTNKDNLKIDPIIFIVDIEESERAEMGFWSNYNWLITKGSSQIKTVLPHKPKLIFIAEIPQSALVENPDVLMQKLQQDYKDKSTYLTSLLTQPIYFFGFIIGMGHQLLFNQTQASIQYAAGTFPANFYELAKQFNEEQLNRLAQALK